MQSQWGVGSSISHPAAHPAALRLQPEEEPEPDKKIDPEVTAAFKHVTRAHGEWDRSKRQFQGTMAMSVHNKHTNNTEMQRELQSIIDNGTAIDDELISMETKLKSGEEEGQDAVKKVKELCDTIFAHKKAGAARNSMLMSWIKMKPSLP